MLPKPSKKQATVTARIEELHMRLHSDPDNALLHVLLGDALLDHFDCSGGSRHNAIDEYELAARLDSSSEETWVALAITLRNALQRDKALATFRKVVALNPGNSDAYNAIGNLIKRDDRWEEAVQEYREAIRYSPKHFAAHYNLGKTLLEHDILDASLATLERALQLRAGKNDRADTFRFYGIALQESGRWDDAERAYRMALTLRPDCSEVYTNLGTVFHAREQWDEAIVCYTEALGVLYEADFNLRDFSRNYYNIADALREKGHLDTASAYYEKAAKAQPNDAQTHYYWGLTLRHMGKGKDAARQFRKVLKFAPKGEYGALACAALAQ